MLRRKALELIDGSLDVFGNVGAPHEMIQHALAEASVTQNVQIDLEVGLSSGNGAVLAAKPKRFIMLLEDCLIASQSYALEREIGRSSWQHLVEEDELEVGDRGEILWRDKARWFSPGVNDDSSRPFACNRLELSVLERLVVVFIRIQGPER